MLNTVSKEVVKPTQIRNLPFIDVDIDSVIIPIRSVEEANMLLKEIRGF